MGSAEPMPGRCGAKARDGYCTQHPIPGNPTGRCRYHPGRPGVAGARAKGAVVTELARWGLGDTTVDPGEILLRLVTQSAARVQLYSGLLEEAYQAGERLRADRAALDLGTAAGELRDELTAPAELRRIFTTGGVAALIGYKYDATKDGDIYAAEEATRGLAKLEAEERDRCANFAAKAVAAGLAERQVRLAERQGQEMASVFRRVLDRLDLTTEQRALVPGLLAQEVAAITGRQTIIEGTAA